MLKKLTVILLLGVHLFNIVGYKAFFQYFITSSDQQVLQRLDRDGYSDAELSEIKVALGLPYLTYRKSYERVDGEIVINGVHYNYVKRKISNDTLYLQCLPNFTKTKLSDAETKYANEAGNNSPDSKSNNIKKSSISNEYSQQLPNYELAFPVIKEKNQYHIHTSMLINTILQIHIKPPEVC
jgi:hypothetical protein